MCSWKCLSGDNMSHCIHVENTLHIYDTTHVLQISVEQDHIYMLYSKTAVKKKNAFEKNKYGGQSGHEKFLLV